MNVVGHMAVAVHGCPEVSTAFLVGSMLPDLAAMARVRLLPMRAPDEAGTDDDAFAAGVAFHHASDAVFHSSAWFTEHNRSLRDALLAAGIEPGAARACAHAGLEMLLDGALVADDAVDRRARGAFATVGATADDLAALVDPGARPAWRARLRAISHSIDPQSYADPVVVAERLHRMTAGRRLIELRRAQVDVAGATLADYRHRVVDDAEGIVDRVWRAVEHDVSVRAWRGLPRSHPRPE